MIRRLDDRDLWSGFAFVAIGVAALALGRGLTIGTAAEMGEGYLPVAMALLLIAIGTLIALLAWLRGPPAPERRLETMRWRPLLFVTAGILAFAAALESLGLIAAIAASVVAANFAGEPLRARPLLILICVLSLGVTGVFLWGLGLPVNALPRIAG
ncbi:MAG: tripartite tricarboxylate transporter TctB family protein [Betaproteobacteria bacterium]